MGWRGGVEGWGGRGGWRLSRHAGGLGFRGGNRTNTARAAKYHTWRRRRKEEDTASDINLGEPTIITKEFNKSSCIKEK